MNDSHTCMCTPGTMVSWMFIPARPVYCLVSYKDGRKSKPVNANAIKY